MFWEAEEHEDDEEMEPEPEGILGLLFADLDAKRTSVLSLPTQDALNRGARASFSGSRLLLRHHSVKAVETLTVYDYRGWQLHSIKAPAAGLLVPEEFEPPPVAWAPGDTAVAMRSGRGVVLWDLAGEAGGTVRLVRYEALHLAWSPDSSHAYLGPSKQQRVCTLVSPGDKARVTLPVQQSFFWSRGAAWGSSLAVLACSDRTDDWWGPCNQLHLFKVTGTQLALERTITTSGGRYFAFGCAEVSPEGDLLASVTGCQQANVWGRVVERRIMIVHMPTGRLTEYALEATLAAHCSELALRWSPDGAFLLVSGSSAMEGDPDGGMQLFSFVAV